MRERGLKAQRSQRPPDRSSASLPMRERGLKVEHSFGIVLCVLSLPMRERGLKVKKVLEESLVHSRSLCGSVD